MTDLDTLAALCNDGISLNECDLAQAVPALIAEVRAARDLIDHARHDEGCNYPYGEAYGCRCGYLRRRGAYDRAVSGKEPTI